MSEPNEDYVLYTPVEHPDGSVSLIRYEKGKIETVDCADTDEAKKIARKREKFKRGSLR